MVFHNLDRADIIMIYSVGCYSVFATQQVGTLYVELVDVLALILDFAGVRHINTWHTFQHIADTPVLCLCKSPDIVCDGIPLLTDAVGFHRNLFKHCCRSLHDDCNWQLNAVKFYSLLCKTHHRHIESVTLDFRSGDCKLAVGIRSGILLYFPLGSA